MTTFALLSAVNGYPTSPLRGCENDVDNMHALLTQTCGVPAENVRVLREAQATKASILGELELLTFRAQRGDVVVWHYSGHGSQLRDPHHDEADGLDECVVPYFSAGEEWWRDPLTDDVLRARVVTPLARGVTFVAVLDSCHSGTMLRESVAGFTETPHGPVRARYLRPPLAQQVAARQPARTGWRSWVGLGPPLRAMGAKLTARVDLMGGSSAASAILLAGCRAGQTSADAEINGQPCGAFTWSLCESVRAQVRGGRMPSYAEALAGARFRLKHLGFSQVPQLQGASTKHAAIFAPVVQP